MRGERQSFVWTVFKPKIDYFNATFSGFGNRRLQIRIGATNDCSINAFITTQRSQVDCQSHIDTFFAKNRFGFSIHRDYLWSHGTRKYKFKPLLLEICFECSLIPYEFQ